jgi:hypothetical protein
VADPISRPQASALQTLPPPADSQDRRDHGRLAQASRTAECEEHYPEQATYQDTCTQKPTPSERGVAATLTAGTELMDDSPVVSNYDASNGENAAFDSKRSLTFSTVVSVGKE